MDIAKLHTFKAFPTIEERPVWEALAVSDEKRRLVAAILADAEKVLSEPVPSLSALNFMDYARNGNRLRYENPYFRRRSNLASLVLAECIEDKGRFIDAVICHIWDILGEPTWCVPAHTGALPDPFPFIDYPAVDLFAAETGMYLAQTLELLSSRLEAVSRNLVARIRKEIVERLIEPVETDISRYWWSKNANNWNVWICSNLIWTANTVLAGDDARFDAFARLLSKPIKLYYDSYPEDGACLEGPGYWNVSVPKYFLFMEAMRHASDGAVSCGQEPKFQNMCRYLADAWYDGDMNVRFADCGSRHNVAIGVMRAMAEYANVPETIALADMLDELGVDYPRVHTPILPFLYSFFTHRHPEIVRPERSFRVYGQSQQLFWKRGRLLIAIKGGGNDEPHNHNDVGHFVIGKEGLFHVLDMGTASYTRSSFSADRYKNYPQSGLSHNPLVFNGIPQQAGNYHAEHFEASGDENTFTCRMEISSCYPKELGLRSYWRSFAFDGHTLVVKDEWQAERPLTPTMTLLHQPPTIKYTSPLASRTEPYPLDDPGLQSAWGATLYRTILTGTPASNGSVTVAFSLA